MNNTLIVSKVSQNGNRIDYQYTVEGEWKRFFREETTFFAEYTQNVGHIPQSIAVLPLLGNVIVLASLMDAQIFVDEIDQDFYECVPSFLSGYQSISPHVHFKTSDLILAKHRIKAALAEPKENLLFFSGGVDAWSSLVTHMDEKPALVSIWGADVMADNSDGWKKISQEHHGIADQFNLPYIEIHSNIHDFLYKNRLDEFAFDTVNDNWWSAFQHSVGMMTLAAPLAAGQRRKLYFGSTYCAKDKKEWGSYVTASDPKIDNHVRFCGCAVQHDGYEFNRLEKVERICSYFQNKTYTPRIRACYSNEAGENCGHCEKCANTIMEILLAGYEPKQYGFPYDEKTFPKLFAAGIQEMAREEKYALLSFYKMLQDAYREQYTLDQVPLVLKAFYLLDLEILADFLCIPCNKCELHKDPLRYLEEVVIAKQWLEGQYHALLQKVSEQEQVISQLNQSGREVWEGKQWLEKEYHILQEKVAEQDAKIEQMQGRKNIKKKPWWKRGK